MMMNSSFSATVPIQLTARLRQYNLLVCTAVVSPKCYQIFKVNKKSPQSNLGRGSVAGAALSHNTLTVPLHFLQKIYQFLWGSAPHLRDGSSTSTLGASGGQRSLKGASHQKNFVSHMYKSAFQKTCATTQKRIESYVCWILKKNRKKHKNTGYLITDRRTLIS